MVSLDKALYGGVLCGLRQLSLLGTSNKQQINGEEVKEATEKLGNRQLLSE